MQGFKHWLTIFMLFTAGLSHGLTVGVENTDYSPYFSLDNKQQYHGAARDVIDLFIKTEQLSVSYSPMPVPRLFSEFKRGQVDFKFPDNPLWSASYQEEVQVHYSKPVLPVNESVLVMTSDKNAEVKTIGKFIGFSIPGIQDKVRKENIEIVEAKTLKQLIQLLISERVDAIYFNEEVARSLADSMYPPVEHPDKQVVVHPDFKTFAYGYHLSSIKHPELIAKFDQFLVKHSDAIDKILQGYGLSK